MDKQEVRLSGKFIINDVEKVGDLLYYEEQGVIYLIVDYKLSMVNLIGEFDTKCPKTICGEISSGHKLTLFECNVVSNNSTLFQYKRVCYGAKFLVWDDNFGEDSKFNIINIKTGNLLAWSNLNGITADLNEISTIIHRYEEPKKIVLQDYTITFKTTFTSDLFARPILEKAITEQYLNIKIESNVEHSIYELIKVKDLILDFISFGIKNNIEIMEMSLSSNDRKFKLEEDATEEFHKIYVLWTSDKKKKPYKTNFNEFNFNLDNLMQWGTTHNILES